MCCWLLLLILLLLVFEHVCAKHSTTYLDYMGELNRQSLWKSPFWCKLSPISLSQMLKWALDKKSLVRDAIMLIVGTQNIKLKLWRNERSKTGPDNKSHLTLFLFLLLLPHSCPLFLTLILGHTFHLSITTTYNFQILHWCN